MRAAIPDRLSDMLTPLKLTGVCDQSCWTRPASSVLSMWRHEARNDLFKSGRALQLSLRGATQRPL